jgi:hypothetical protein
VVSINATSPRGGGMTKPRKPKKVKADDHPKEAIVLIPLTYNDETRVPQHILDSICEEISIAFRAWTIEGTVKGAYRMRATQQKRVEELLKVSIILKESEIAEFEEMIARWCARLGQEVMLLKIADFIVKFIPPQPEH